MRWRVHKSAIGGGWYLEFQPAPKARWRTILGSPFASKEDAMLDAMQHMKRLGVSSWSA